MKILPQNPRIPSLKCRYERFAGDGWNETANYLKLGIY